MISSGPPRCWAKWATSWPMGGEDLRVGAVDGDLGFLAELQESAGVAGEDLLFYEAADGAQAGNLVGGHAGAVAGAVVVEGVEDGAALANDGQADVEDLAEGFDIGLRPAGAEGHGGQFALAGGGGVNAAAELQEGFEVPGNGFLRGDAPIDITDNQTTRHKRAIVAELWERGKKGGRGAWAGVEEEGERAGMGERAKGRERNSVDGESSAAGSSVMVRVWRRSRSERGIDPIPARRKIAPRGVIWQVRSDREFARVRAARWPTSG